MGTGQILFNAFALLTVVSAAGVVLNRNAVNAALCLLLSLVGVSGLFVALDAYLLAFLLLLVYAGAVVALFLFIVVVMVVFVLPLVHAAQQLEIVDEEIGDTLCSGAHALGRFAHRLVEEFDLGL